MKLITKIASGLGVALAGVAWFIWHSLRMKRQGKKEAYIESQELKEETAQDNRKAYHDIKKETMNDDDEFLEQMEDLGYVKDKKSK